MPAYQLTPEQIALQQERKRKKELAKQLASTAAAPTVADGTNDGGNILLREWVKLRDARNGFSPLKVMTWNVRATCLYGALWKCTNILSAIVDACADPCP